MLCVKCVVIILHLCDTPFKTVYLFSFLHKISDQKSLHGCDKIVLSGNLHDCGSIVLSGNLYGCNNMSCKETCMSVTALSFRKA